MCKSCGMSMYIVWDLKVPFYIMPSLTISKALFPFLMAFILLITLLGNHANEICKNKYFIDGTQFICSWILMLSMMTCNGFILLTMLCGTLLSRAILLRRKKDRSFSCC